MGTSSEFSFAQDGHGRMALKFFVLAVAAVSVHAEADAEAAGPVHAVHHGVPHAGVYGYTPAPPAYGPVEPVYHTTPLEGLSDDDLKAVLKEYYERWVEAESTKYDVERDVHIKEMQIHDLEMEVSDMRGKFILPKLKKVHNFKLMGGEE